MVQYILVRYYGKDYLPMGKNQKPDFTQGLQETLGLANQYASFRSICKVPRVLYSTLCICHLGRLCITYAVKSAHIFCKNLHYKDSLSHYTLFMANTTFLKSTLIVCFIIIIHKHYTVALFLRLSVRLLHSLEPWSYNRMLLMVKVWI